MDKRIAPSTLLLSLATLSFGFDHTIDFEDYPGMTNAGGATIPAGSRISDQLQSSIGILFSSGSPFAAVVLIGTNHATSGTNALAGSNAFGQINYSAANPINFTFWNPSNITEAAGTNSFSVRGDLVSAGGTMSLTAFDFDNNIVDTISLVDTGGNTMVLNSLTSNIHRVQFVGTGNVALDDVQFNTVESVPEPGTILAMSLGAAAIADRRRKSTRTN